MGDGAVQVAGDAGSGAAGPRKTKVSHFGLEAMWVDGTGCQHHISTRQVLHLNQASHAEHDVLACYAR